jgi:broad specificity phosphatase PhoE
MTYVYFIRHARSHANQKNLLIGRSDEHELNDVGYRQAECLAERLGTQGISAFWTSPLRRAVQTAHIVSAAARTAAPVIDNDLIEREYGPFDGMDRARLLTNRA